MRPRLYQRMLALGKRAGVNNAHPHRFRDTLAVDLLSRGASPYDVAKMLGDTNLDYGCRTRVTFGRNHLLRRSVSIINSGRACKPDSVRRCSAHGALQTAAIIPLGPGSHRDSSSLPEGFRFTRLAPT
jgi:hypothetical protein